MLTEYLRVLPFLRLALEASKSSLFICSTIRPYGVSASASIGFSGPSLLLVVLPLDNCNCLCFSNRNAGGFSTWVATFGSDDAELGPIQLTIFSRNVCH